MSADHQAQGLQSIRAAVAAFVVQHLTVLSAELIEWEDTAVVPQGRLRELRSKCEALDPTHAMAVAKSFVHRAALERLIATAGPKTVVGVWASDDREHELKTDPEVFQAVFEGRKTFEIRRNDRGFRVGDRLRLRETEFDGAAMREGKPLVYTGRTMHRVVSHVLSGYGLAADWVCLSMAPHADDGKTEPFASTVAEAAKDLDAIARSKRVLARVDAYMDRPSHVTRGDLRAELMDQFEPLLNAATNKQ